MIRRMQPRNCVDCEKDIIGGVYCPECAYEVSTIERVRTCVRVYAKHWKEDGK